jgi:hypothetical protein
VELRDFIVTPILFVIICVSAYLVKPYFTNSTTSKFFFPALFLKLFAALALGFLYQFYYDGGDTFNYHTHGSRHVWEAFIDSPIKGFTLLFSGGKYVPGIYQYASKIVFFHDPASYFVVQVATVFDLITFSSYSATALLFSVVSFAGGWAMFLAFYDRNPTLYKWQAAATLFIPSVSFWGSGLMKDTLTFSCIGFLTYSLSYLFFRRKFSLSILLFMILSIWVLFSVKKYILLCYMPAAILWVFANRLARIRSLVFKFLAIPFATAIMITIGYYSIILIGEDDARYSINRLALTARITAYDIGFYSGRDAGSGYSLGELDGTFIGMITKAPEAINVSLFRPYLWEVRNPLMLLSAVESLLLIVFTGYVIVRKRLLLFKALADPTIIFCLVFSLTFAFAVGVSTFNFGTLARYKIPLLPFYILALGYLLHYSNNERKVGELEATE